MRHTLEDVLNWIHQTIIPVVFEVLTIKEIKRARRLD